VPATGRATTAFGRNEGKEEREQGQLSRQDKSDQAAAVAAAPLEKQAADSLAKPAPAPAPAIEKAAEPQSGLRDRTAAFALPTAPARDIQSPDPSIRWRIGVRGTVQYSRDQGATWEVVPVNVTVDLVAGAAPSPSVCWVVGRAGTVLLSTDGRRFVRLPFPETTDLLAVRATDARSATVTTADGRTLSTVDGGSTWTAGPR
jgi:photosystem II stability/assembly factor-like uncharacterized protein